MLTYDKRKIEYAGTETIDYDAMYKECVDNEREYYYSALIFFYDSDDTIVGTAESNNILSIKYNNEESSLFGANSSSMTLDLIMDDDSLKTADHFDFRYSLHYYPDNDTENEVKDTIFLPWMYISSYKYDAKSKDVTIKAHDLIGFANDYLFKDIQIQPCTPADFIEELITMFGYVGDTRTQNVHKCATDGTIEYYHYLDEQLNENVSNINYSDLNQTTVRNVLEDICKAFGIQIYMTREAFGTTSHIEYLNIVGRNNTLAETYYQLNSSNIVEFTNDSDTNYYIGAVSRQDTNTIEYTKVYSGESRSPGTSTTYVIKDNPFISPLQEDSANINIIDNYFYETQSGYYLAIKQWAVPAEGEILGDLRIQKDDTLAFQYTNEQGTTVNVYSGFYGADWNLSGGCACSFDWTWCQDISTEQKADTVYNSFFKACYNIDQANRKIEETFESYDYDSLKNKVTEIYNKTIDEDGVLTQIGKRYDSDWDAQKEQYNNVLEQMNTITATATELDVRLTEQEQNGEARTVRTVKDFTFNEDGLLISGDSGSNTSTQIDETGFYVHPSGDLDTNLFSADATECHAKNLVADDGIHIGNFWIRTISTYGDNSIGFYMIN